MRKIEIEKLTIAQVSNHQISGTLIETLRTHAEFVDTDTDLNEFMISTATILNIANDYKEIPHLDTLGLEAENLYDQVKDFNYLQIAFI
jgi:hypothetical protein